MNIYQCFLTSLIVISFGHSQGKSSSVDYSDCSENGGVVVSNVFCLPDSYRKDVPPPSKEQSLIVKFKLPITEISAIDDHKSIVTVRLGYKLKWPESRMVLNDTADWSKGEINISPENIKHFWVPDIVIHDLIKFDKPNIMNEVGALEIQKRNKMVYYKVRSTITFVCKAMEFRQYPLDNHVCSFIMTSFGYDSTRMLLKGTFDYQKKNQRTLPFDVEIVELPTDRTMFSGSSSNYSAYGFDIRVSRSIGPFILSIYLPSAMFVTMSWLSFFIPPDIYPARIALLVTLCLMLINMFNSTTSRIPVSNAVTAMEIWLLTCMVLVFCTLVEYAIILKKMVDYKRKTEIPAKRAMAEGAKGLAKVLFPEMGELQKEEDSARADLLEKDKEKLIQEKINLDTWAAIVFPAGFFVFNLIYWIYYFAT